MKNLTEQQVSDIKREAIAEYELTQQRIQLREAAWALANEIEAFGRACDKSGLDDRMQRKMTLVHELCRPLANVMGHLADVTGVLGLHEAQKVAQRAGNEAYEAQHGFALHFDQTKEAAL